MEITWLGHSCFRITERNMSSVVADPFDHNVIGYEELKLKADIVTISHDASGHNFVDGVKGSKWEIDGPGEYEIGGVFITAIPTGEKGADNGSRNMVFVYDYEGITVAHLGDIKSVPTRKQVEALGNVNILLIPVGGGQSLSAPKATETISLIEPGIVIPMHYGTPDGKMDLNPLDPFLKQMGISQNPEILPSFKVNKSGIPDETKVITLAYKK